ncbi:class I tRNA ligase family protein [Candidatus Parcubacteria bacterium]|nr:class I tRNA ligase family protein [Candidatus Parcubacteria bacterium]
MAEEDKKEVTKSEIALKEEATQRFWEERDIFKKSEGRGTEEFVFYDGPPFATGLPHYGHILAGTIKDAIPRYQVMQGKRLRRRWGWDCHGLPLENQIEAELGIKTKKDIEALGVATFVEKARSAVLRYAEDWKRIIPRLGRFVDMVDDYRTMDSTYTESVWWSFKTLHDKDLVYKNFKSMHLCPRCGTTLSNFEVNQGYKDITDLSVTVKFELVEEPGTYLLAWTTTPWTLPGNVAAAVNPEFMYVKVSKEGAKYILAKERLSVIEGEYAVEGEFSGADLVGKSYKPLFDYYVNETFDNKENAWKVYAAPYVTLEDGTGIVHLAPAFGAEDMALARQHNIPLIHHVGMDGKFTDKVRDFVGLEVKPKGDHQRTDIEIVKYLAHNGLLFSKAKVTHSYPHCWRCDTPLLNYAATSWFVKVPEIKSQIVKENKEIHWVPQSVGEYRFGNWLEGAPDWAISRSRFWGAPLPVWEHAESGKRLVIGSLEELKAYMPRSGNRYFVMRHGEAENNTLDIVSSLPATPHHLTEKGKEQVAQGAETLKENKIELIVSSPFVRAQETAQIAAKIMGASVQTDVRLSEVNVGASLEGKKIPEYYGYFSTMEERFTKTPPGGENLSDVKRRVTSLLYELDKTHVGKNILIVTHESAASSLFAGAAGMNKKESAALKASREQFLLNGEVRELMFSPLPHNDDYELDFHRPYIDDVVLKDAEGREYRRVPEVFDCWFESGSMPYAQDHYPFKKDHFDPESGKGYPADFIAEGLDQTRGWFYSLLVLGVALFGRAPYKHVIVNGLVLAEDGQKMSKRLKNYPDPMDVANKYGADAMRLYLLSSPIVQGSDLNFSERGVDEILKKNIMRFENVLAFYELYAKEMNAVASGPSEHLLDRWILARLNHIVMEVTQGMEAYELDSAVRPIFAFIDDLSVWYLRRSRERIKEGGSEGASALVTLREALRTTALLLAPFAPFVAERVYEKVRLEGGEESVHLASWPKPESVTRSEECLSVMESVRALVTFALDERTKKGMKVRQPLALLRVPELPFSNEKDRSYVEDILKDEVNVKRIEFSKDLENRVELDTTLTPELEEEGRVRDFMRAVQDLRKKSKLEPGDHIALTLSEAPAFLEKYRADISKTVNAESIEMGTIGGEYAEADGIKFSILKR